MPTALVVAADLLMGERLVGAAGAAGFEVTRMRSPTQPEGPPHDLVALDLDLPGALAWLTSYRQSHPSARVVGFVSHVDHQTWVAAEALGCDVHARGEAPEAAEIFSSS